MFPDIEGVRLTDTERGCLPSAATAAFVLGPVLADTGGWLAAFWQGALRSRLLFPLMAPLLIGSRACALRFRRTGASRVAIAAIADGETAFNACFLHGETSLGLEIVLKMNCV